jgi:23S rRNA U2552 (ribose-2'-O)-methylase RlmE/FtsJ
MSLFHDRRLEDLGTRQKRWLDYLWFHNNQTPPKTCHEYEKKKYSPWENAESCVCPIDHRSIIQGEAIIEFDNSHRQQNLKFIQEYLKSRRVQTYLQDHNGRSPHLHAFNIPRNIRLEKNAPLRKARIDLLKLQGSGLCREIGGTYYKEGKTYYASAFEDVDDIRPTTNRKDVEFPKCLRLN